MKFGLISLDFRRFPLERCFAIAHRYGYDGVEIWGGRPHAAPQDMDAAAVQAIKAMKRRFCLEVPMYTPAVLGMGLCLCSESDAERSDAIRLYEKAAEVASELEVPSVLAVADHPGYEADPQDTWRRLVDSAVTLADYAAPLGVDFCFEPLTPVESPVLTTADDCVRLLADADRPNLCAMLDVVPPTVVCEPMSSYFAKLGGKMRHIHLCNSDGVTDAHLAFDDGVLSIPDVLRLFTEIHYQGFVVAELYSATTKDPELVAAQTMRLINEAEALLEGPNRP